MAAAAWDHIDFQAQKLFGFIAIDEHTHKGCVVHEVTDLGACLVMVDTSDVPSEFVLYSYAFDKAQPCRAIWRTDEVIGAWFDGAAT